MKSARSSVITLVAACTIIAGALTACGVIDNTPAPTPDPYANWPTEEDTARQYNVARAYFDENRDNFNRRAAMVVTGESENANAAGVGAVEELIDESFLWTLHPVTQPAVGVLVVGVGTLTLGDDPYDRVVSGVPFLLEFQPGEDEPGNPDVVWKGVRVFKP